MSDKPFFFPDIATHSIESRYVDQTFQVKVMQPLMRKGGAERFPVLYMTDANLGFDVAKGICQYLQTTGEVRRFILVGIGYPGDNPFTGHLLRLRDFTSEGRAGCKDAPRTAPIEGVPEIAEGRKYWGGAADFQSFICHELIPFVDREFPALPDDRAYFGHSAGGGFGFHSLFTQSTLFRRYVLSSPTVSYDGEDFGLRQVQEFIASGQRLDAQLVMSVGGEEEFEGYLAKLRFVSSISRVAALLRQASLPGLDFTSRIYAGQTHAKVWPIAFSDGIQVIYGSADRPPLAAQ